MASRKKATTAAEAQQITDEVKQQMEPIQSAETTALAVQQPAGALATVDPDYDFGEDAGGGHEQRRSEDNFVPRLSILQALSPEVQECKDGSLRAGMIYENMTGRAWDGEVGVEMTLAYYETVWNEWIPRKQWGGGYVATHPWDDEHCQMAAAKAKADNGGKPVPRVPSGNTTKDGKPTEFVETTTAFGYITQDGEMLPFSFAHKSTHLKAIKQITSAAGTFRLDPKRDKAPPPLFAFSVRMRTRLEKFTEGSAYVPFYEPAVAIGPGPAWEYSPDGKRTFNPAAPNRKGLGASINPSSSSVYGLCKKLRDDVAKGILKADHAADEQAGGKVDAADESIPF
jgi:hypothetical protein